MSDVPRCEHSLIVDHKQYVNLFGEQLQAIVGQV